MGSATPPGWGQPQPRVPLLQGSFWLLSWGAPPHAALLRTKTQRALINPYIYVCVDPGDGEKKKAFLCVCVCKILVQNSRADFQHRSWSVPTPEPTAPTSTEPGLPPAALPPGSSPMPTLGGCCCLQGSSAEGAERVHQVRQAPNTAQHPSARNTWTQSRALCYLVWLGLFEK